MLEISDAYLLAATGGKEAALQRLDAIEATYPEFIRPEGQMKVIRTDRARRQITRGTTGM
jgi:hypothetical protein